MYTLVPPSPTPQPHPQFRDGPHGLEAIPPDEGCRCGARRWIQVGLRWQCSSCWATALTPAPSAAERDEIAEGRRQGRADAAVAAEAELRAARARAFTRTRDRRPLDPIRRDWHVLLLHRANPTRYPFPASAREWREDSLMDLAAKHLELSGIDPVPLGRGGVSRRALERTRGAATWLSLTTRSPAGYQAAGDFGALLDGVGATVFLERSPISRGRIRRGRGRSRSRTSRAPCQGSRPVSVARPALGNRAAGRTRVEHARSRVVGAGHGRNQLLVPR